MLTKNEFYSYIKNHIEVYDAKLKEASISLEDVKKNNGIHTGLLIRQNGAQSAPIIYLDSIYEDYLNGATMQECMEHLLNFYYENVDKISKNFDDVQENLNDYASIQNHLHVRICDIERNPDFLENKPYKEVGDYAAYYVLELPMLSTEEGEASVTVTNDMLRHWGVSKETVYEDAMQSVSDENVCFFSLDKYFHSVFIGDPNQFNIPIFETKQLDTDLYCLTNRNQKYGASSLLNASALQAISSRLGENFYILPSSVHEVIIVPETLAGSVSELNEMIRNVNDTEVSQEEQLSSHAQYFDQEKGIFYNPEKVKNFQRNLKATQKENVWLPKI